MNGDLSLSQTFGGLRIANPDDDATSGHSSPNVSRRAVPLGQAMRPPDASQHARTNENSVPSLAGPEPGHYDLQSLGFDPSAYTAPPNAFPTYISPVQPEQSVPQHRLVHRQSMPLRQDPQTNPSPAPRHPNHAYRPNSRPTSGIYSQPNKSSSSNIIPESTYQRVRAESTQSSHSSSSVARRNPSRSNPAAPGRLDNSFRGPAPPISTPNGYPYRSSSQTNPPVVGYPPRQSSKNDTNDQPESSRKAHGTDESRQVMETLAPNGVSSLERLAATETNASSDPEAVSKPATTRAKKGVKDFNFGRTLGEGSYSTVLAATDRSDMKEYAIKVLDKKHIIKEKKVKYVNIEKDTLNRLTQHPGIVRLYSTFQDERSLYFVLDLASGGELLGVLKKIGSFDETCTRFYGAQILDAIEYMHSRGVIHRDLKPENVLLDDKMHVKITDFGTAKLLDMSPKATFGIVSINNDPMDGADSDRAVSFVGTAEYVSPELLTDKNACKASDLWAFGCIIYQLIAGRPPFKAANEYQTFQKIVHLEYSFPDGFPPRAKDLIKKLLVLDPNKRLPISDIKSHPFFEDIEWGKGLWKEEAPQLRRHNPRDHPQQRGLASSAAAAASQNANAQATEQSDFVKKSTPTPPRPQPRLITEMAPPSQLDIDWSPVLTKTNERILKLGQMMVYTLPAPHSPTSKQPPESADTSSKFSRFFGGNASKKRQRLVMLTSGARLVLAPAGGDKKEAKLIIDLLDPDTGIRTQQDSKGYTVWNVSTRDKYMTFEDSKVNTGDSGSSVRSTQEWMQMIEEVKQHAMQQQISSSYSGESMNGLSPVLTRSQDPSEKKSSPRNDATSLPMQRKTLRKDPNAVDDDGLKGGRRRFSRRHSKNGLAAVF